MEKTQKTKQSSLSNVRLNNGGPVRFLLYLIVIYCKVLLYLKYISWFLAHSLFEITFQVTFYLISPKDNEQI